MALAFDASRPATVTNSTTTGTTASFTPVANSLLVALVSIGNPLGNATPATGTITDSLGSTWTRKLRQTAGSTGDATAELWMLDAGASPSARTVTLTANYAGIQLDVRVITGALAVAAQTGATGSTSAVVNTVSLTPTTVGSYIVGAVADSEVSHILTANANSTVLTTSQDSSNGATYGSWRSTNTTSTLSSTAFGYTNTPQAGDNWAHVAMEILPSAAAFTRSADFTGSGTLTATSVIGYTRAAALTGAGTLTATQAPGPVQAAGLTGSGTLTATQTPRPVQAAGLTGRARWPPRRAPSSAPQPR